MKWIRVAMVAAVPLLTSLGCMLSAPVIPPPGIIQTYHAPLDLDNDQTQVGAKHGSASSQNVLGIVTWGDASSHAAAQDGGISTIRSADYEFFTVLGIYSKYTTIVHGN